MRQLLERLEPRRLCAAGDHDLSYGDNGFVRLAFGQTPYQFLPGSAPLGVATVVSTSPDGASFQLRRYSTGTPDPTAGPGGVIATIPLPFRSPAGAPELPTPQRVWNLSDGRTLIEFTVPQRDAQAFASRDGYIVRLNPDRSLDRTFGTDGAVFFAGRFPLDAVQQGDNLIAINGPRTVRFNADLALDTPSARTAPYRWADTSLCCNPTGRFSSARRLDASSA